MVIISYAKTNWIDGFTPLSAEKLNNIENGIKELEDKLEYYVKAIDIINTINSSGTGSLILPNKFMIQVGTANYNSSSEGWQKGYTVVSLGKQFANTNYKVVATSRYSGGATDMLPTIQNRDTQSFNVYIRNLDKAIPMVEVTVNYIAIGVSP
ncbi:hypothetical protein HYH96_02570 [Clostridium botulinum]|uniref:Uncharacterized protein n=1 Tax=Clostridium botulinum TaxID=1491 RepID=A0A6G4EDG2_CLOBO|nr:hypothetical protein [Clostridium botulinum]AUM91501.1 hypothetical protein RSJ5_09520 [Clostridium botulinum]MBD5642779.1 hypothetical protein [Clostridium botulinum]NFH57829.1 hypothetical protein [Clostridium botulinum]NFH61208.1 hypothetical protein [Clostridium botulinum]NFJ87298.1 hypothetical protein [Clostridium botulinum]